MNLFSSPNRKKTQSKNLSSGHPRRPISLMTSSKQWIVSTKLWRIATRRKEVFPKTRIKISSLSLLIAWTSLRLLILEGSTRLECRVSRDRASREINGRQMQPLRRKSLLRPIHPWHLERSTLREVKEEEAPRSWRVLSQKSFACQAPPQA